MRARVLLPVLAALCATAAAGAVKKASQWKSLDFDKLERGALLAPPCPVALHLSLQVALSPSPSARLLARHPRADLEAGDDPALLMSEDAVDLELMQRRKEMPLEPPPGVQLE